MIMIYNDTETKGRKYINAKQILRLLIVRGRREQIENIY